MRAAILLVGLCGVVAFGQREAAKAARRDPPAPTDKSASWNMMEMKAVGLELAGSKETTHRFFGEKGFNMEVRRLAGPQPILQHGKKSDFMVIQDGEGTFMSGESIRGGTSRVLKAGDVMFVPAGAPHGFVETKDHVTFVMVRFDTK